MMAHDDQCRCSSFGCHVTVSDMAPGFCVKEMMGRGEVRLLTWAHHCPCLYVAAGHRSRAVVDGCWLVVVRLCMWVAVFVCGWSASFVRQSWQRGGRELWLVLGIVSWLLSAASLGCGWWLVEERNGCHML